MNLSIQRDGGGGRGKSDRFKEQHFRYLESKGIELLLEEEEAVEEEEEAEEEEC